MKINSVNHAKKQKKIVNFVLKIQKMKSNVLPVQLPSDTIQTQAIIKYYLIISLKIINFFAVIFK